MPVSTYIHSSSRLPRPIVLRRPFFHAECLLVELARISAPPPVLTCHNASRTRTRQACCTSTDECSVILSVSHPPLPLAQTNLSAWKSSGTSRLPFRDFLFLPSATTKQVRALLQRNGQDIIRELPRVLCIDEFLPAEAVLSRQTRNGQRIIADRPVTTLLKTDKTFHKLPASPCKCKMAPVRTTIAVARCHSAVPFGLSRKVSLLGFFFAFTLKWLTIIVRLLVLPTLAGRRGGPLFLAASQLFLVSFFVVLFLDIVFTCSVVFFPQPIASPPPDEHFGRSPSGCSLLTSTQSQSHPAPAASLVD